MRLTRVLPNGQQHLTIPAHKPLRVGTLRQVLKDVANADPSAGYLIAFERG